MKKIKVGILPTSHLFENDDPYQDQYSFINGYSKKISENGGVPVGILLNDNELDYASLEMCDAFLLCGGNKIQPYAFKTINYAIKQNKPLLGICLGMQTIGVYSYLENKLIKKELPLEYENIIKEYEEIKQQKIYFLEHIENHYKGDVTRNNYEQNKHNVTFNKQSILNDIYKSDKLSVLSMHSYKIAKLGDNVMIGATDDNKITESIEYKNKDLFILGVQWHPELEDEHNTLFAKLINEAKKRL